MALIGDFNDTPFADLIQLYAGSGQTVAVTINLPDGKGEDGVFYVENGDVVDAWLGDAHGRDAVRQALRLDRGSFIVEQDVRAAERTLSMPWRQLLMEEVVRMDEERRRGGAAARSGRGAGQASGATPGASGALPLPGATPRTPPAIPLQAASGAGSVPRLTPTRPSAPPSATPASPARPTAAGATPAPGRPASGGGGLRAGAMVAIAAVVVGAAGAGFFLLRGRGSATVEARPAPAAGAAQAAAEVPTLTFGMVSPLSGPDKDLGRGMKAGVELAFAAANEAGGVHGRRLALVAVDDGNDPARAAEAMRELTEQRKVFAVVGNAGTATAGAAVPVALERKVPFIGALGGAPALRSDPPQHDVFVYRPSLSEEAAAAVRYLVEVRRLDPGDIAVFAQDDESGQAGWTGAAQQLKSYGRDPAQTVRVSYRRNTAEVDGAVERLRAMGAHLKGVVMVAAHRPAARLVEKVIAFAPGTVFTDTSSVDVAQLGEELVGSRVGLADNVVVTQVVPLPTSRSSAVMRYRALLEKYALGETPGALSLEGWIVGTLVVKALEAAGRDADPEKLVAALEGFQNLDIGIGAPLTFSRADHQASHKVWGTALDRSGAWRQVDLE
ncbi:ABC transporter substrate-binding protein [Anaeromyxobacter diazotrophicus]|uniref:Extracellular ligand-binding receptor n=1 Tax=Anaeromyxobacter diazotrophicus TaxID=2590199 RepID=A0A7I9VPT8_9BACT|nr:ABC transporter substrate-binding protein [Anaeromyxobacter diazotrophicus]GEJ58371.1 hypothetical protein AMYX_31120 [Anaeromyxobacter diazotrophicus]